MKKYKRAPRKLKFQIYSIFGQCEAAAAEHFIAHHGAYRIGVDRIPSDALKNETGVIARFAVLIQGKDVAAFNAMCEALRS